MKLLKDKKSIELALSTIGIAILILIVVFVLLCTFTNSFGKQKGQINEQIDALDDFDVDGTANIFDKCPCDANVEPNEEGKCPTDPPRSCLKKDSNKK